MEGIFVMMPIKVLNKQCSTCVDLDIDTDCYPVIEGDKRQIIQHMVCRNLPLCCRIRDQILREAEEETTKAAEVKP